jgi:hypothetical protein
MQSLRQLLEAFHERHGYYPKKLEQAVDDVDLKPEAHAFFRAASDSWGHALQYRTGEGGFLLISPGRDGALDRPSYWEARRDSANLDGQGPEYWRVCKDSRVDLVASDKAWHRCCGK